VEAQTGRPLARTLVVASPVAGTAGTGKSILTNVYGTFELEGLAAGTYIVTASRRAFAATQYGQKQWKSAGLPVVLEEPQKMQIEIRLPRLGAIAGKVVDENDVGLPEHDVVVFRNTRPPVLVNRISSDDRGMFRFGLLEPGAYLVRTASKAYEDGGYVPTFYKDVMVVEQARQIETALDQETGDIVIRPMPGRLFQLSGTAYVPIMPTPITVTLSDMGVETITADSRTGHFQFNPQAPGKYELNISAAAPRGQYAGDLPFDLDRDLTDIRISGTQLPSVLITLEDNKGGRVDNSKLQVLARRKELSGPGARENVDASGRGVQLAPGRWEFAIAPNPAYYAVGFMARQYARGWPRGWVERNCARQRRIRVIDSADQVHPVGESWNGSWYRQLIFAVCGWRSGVSGALQSGSGKAARAGSHCPYGYARPVSVHRPGTWRIPPSGDFRIPSARSGRDRISQASPGEDRRSQGPAAGSGVVRGALTARCAVTAI
jgi:hypothetical protein